MLQQLGFAIRPLKALQPRLPMRHLGQQVEMIAHEAVSHHLDARELRHAPDHAPQRLFLSVIKEHLAPTGARHHMVTIRLQRPLAQDAMPPTRPRPRAGIEPGFRIHADKLFFEWERLGIRGLGGLHGAENGSEFHPCNN